jgi:hypothetical protein
MNNQNTLATAGAAPFYLPVADKRFADKKGYGEHLGLCERTVGNLLKQGLPHLKIGSRRVRIDVAEADAWMRKTYGQ